MISLGKKRETGAIAQAMPESKSKTFYPYLSISDITTELPVTEDMIGDEVEAKVKLRLTRTSEYLNSENKKKKFSYEFDVLAIDKG